MQCGGPGKPPFFFMLDFIERLFYNIQNGGDPLERQYIAIDLKSFYASVECRERGLDPLTTNLVVADSSRTDKTICLAVSPSLKSFGTGGRPRLFELKQCIAQANALRRSHVPGHRFAGKSVDSLELKKDPAMEIDFIIAPPQMARYMACSAQIYGVYLKYIAPEDILVYSIDEVFIHATPYLKTYRTTAEALARKLIRAVLDETGITATAGVGTNLYLCKVAMDIVAKKMDPDRYGVRIASLCEESYRRLLWDHKPITDFWRVGPGYAKRLQKAGLYTMGDIARCSLGQPEEYYNQELLYRLFGVNAELLIDHAWGREPVTLEDIKAYRPATNCLSSGQVLHSPYPWEKARLIVREMADSLSLELAAKGLVTDQLVLTVGYDISNVGQNYRGVIVTDHYGRKLPKHGHGTTHLPFPTASTRQITQAMVALFDRIADPSLLVRRVNLTADRIQPDHPFQRASCVQLDLFSAPEAEPEHPDMERETRRQKAILAIKGRFGKNAILKAMNLQEGATAADRNRQIGGHRA